MSSIIKVGKVQSSTGNDAITVADSGAITANGTLTSTGAITASGGIANAGTISAGTLGSSVVVPATTSSCVKLYANDVSGVANISVDGYFDDTKYGLYEMHLKNVRISSNDTGLEFLVRANTGGSANSGNIYWSASGGNYNYDGSAGEFNRADNDGGTEAFMDNTWALGNAGSSLRSASYILKFSNPQKTDRWKLFFVTSYGNSHENSATYDCWIDTKVISVETSTALTGLTFLMNGSTSTILQAEILLLGFRK